MDVIQGLSSFNQVVRKKLLEKKKKNSFTLDTTSKLLDSVGRHSHLANVLLLVFEIIGKSHYRGQKGRNVYVAPYCDRM